MFALKEPDIEEFLRHFPPIDFAVAYGSGVVAQSGYDYTKPASLLPMIDMIFAVEDANSWHSLNRLLNPDHYASDLPLSSSSISYVQENFGAGLWYNPYVKMNIRKFPDRMIKYGVITTKMLVDDLVHWRWLYASGRFHKPVHVLKRNKIVEHAMSTNLDHAISAALLLLPHSFSEQELFHCIASLSYTGDPRMGVAENPNKINNLVLPQLSKYKDLYHHALRKQQADPIVALHPQSSSGSSTVFQQVRVLSEMHDTASVTSGVQSMSPQARWQLVHQLPSTIKSMLKLGGTIPHGGDQVLQAPPTVTDIQSSIKRIVSRSVALQFCCVCDYRCVGVPRNNQ